MTGVFHTHFSHELSENLFAPTYWNAQLLARVVEPLPGAGKDHPLWGLVIRIASLALWILTLPLAAICAIVAFPLRCINHRNRPLISTIAPTGPPPQKPPLSKERPLHLRTHNLGFVPSTLSIIGDLRPPTERAKELIESILTDPQKPDLMVFQEAFHEDAVRLLCEGIKREYPYIAHSIAPHISGLSSGALIASKYPLEEIEFKRLGHQSLPESIAPRGIVKVRLNTEKGPLLIYSAHLEPLIGEKRSEARFEQLEEIRQYMMRDAGALQILMGDFNTSRVTAWGEDNLKPKGQAEEKVIERIAHYFDDLYLKDHDPLTGLRTSGKPTYLRGQLPEPSGSWYYGPFANPGWILAGKMRFDRWRYNRPAPERAQGIRVGPNTWGTPAWYSQQPANTARFDYILIPKGSRLDGHVEIRRVSVPKEAQSAPTDHLPVDGRIWVKDPLPVP